MLKIYRSPWKFRVSTWSEIFLAPKLHLIRKIERKSGSVASRQRPRALNFTYKCICKKRKKKLMGSTNFYQFFLINPPILPMYLPLNIEKAQTDVKISLINFLYTLSPSKSGSLRKNMLQFLIFNYHRIYCFMVLIANW